MTSAHLAKRYGMVPQLLHWATVCLVIIAWTLGMFGDELPKGNPRATGLFIHISAGLLILTALIIRLAWRLAEPPPPPEPNELGNWLGVSPTRLLVLPITRSTLCWLPFLSPASLRNLQMVMQCHYWE